MQKMNGKRFFDNPNGNENYLYSLFCICCRFFNINLTFTIISRYFFYKFEFPIKIKNKFKITKKPVFERRGQLSSKAKTNFFLQKFTFSTFLTIWPGIKTEFSSIVNFCKLFFLIYGEDQISKKNILRGSSHTIFQYLILIHTNIINLSDSSNAVTEVRVEYCFTN